ncbi:MAG: PAS domain S-box protein [Chitinophagaceae bacterium]
MKPAPGKTLKIGIFLLLIAVLAVLFLLQRQSNHLKQATSFVAHTNEVLYQSEKVLSAVRKNKVILRDFILTGDEQQLHLLGRSNDSILFVASKLKKLTADNASQQKHCDSLLFYLNQNNLTASKIIAIRKENGMAAAAKAMEENTGNQYTDLMQQTIRQIEENENILLAQRKEASERSTVRQDNILLWLTAAVLVLVLILILTGRIDFLARKQSEQELTEREKEVYLLSQLVQQTNDAIFSMDKNISITSWNKGAEKLYGYSSKEAIGRNSSLLLKSRFTDQQRDKILKDLDKNGFYRTELEYSNKKGETIFVLTSVTHVKSDRGEITGYVAVHKDITERKRLEGVLLKLNRELEEKVQAKTAELTGIFERITDGFVAFDKNWRYTYINKKAGELIRQDPASMIGKNVWEEFPAAVGSSTYNIFNDAMTRQEYLYNTDYYPPLDLWQENHVYPSPDGISVFIKDITAKKKAEEEINRSNERFNIIANATNDAVWDWDLINHTIWWNKNYYQRFGYSKEESTPVSSRYNGIHPEDRQRVAEGINYALETGQPYWSDEYRFLRADGSTVYVLDRGNIMYNAKNKPYRMVGAMVDVTSIKKAEEKIITNEKRFRALLQNSTDGLALLDAENNIIDMSPSGYQILGYTAEELIGGRRLELIHPEDLDMVLETLDKVIKTPGLIIVLEQRHRLPNQTYKWLECSYNNLLEEPYVNAVVINYRDITDRKLAEEKIRNNEKMLTRAEEIGQFGSWEYDAITHKINWSDSMYNIHGLSKEHPINLELFFQQLYPPDVSKVKNVFWNLQEKEQRVKDEYRFIKGQNEIRYAHTTLDAVFENGKFSKALGVIQDITEEKLAEENLRRSEHKYRLLFENNPMPMWMTSVAELNILDVNEAALKQYGYTREEFLSLNSKDLRIPEDMDIQAPEDSPPLPGEGITLQWRHKKKDGSIIYVEIFNYQITYEGKPVWLGLSIDITEKKKAEALLKQSYEDIRELATHLQDIREEERAAIAREIHDELGQQLTGLKMDISWLARKKDLTEQQRDQKIKEILSFLDGTVTTVRKISSDLRPSILDDLGLVEALEWFSMEFEKRSGVSTLFIRPEQTIVVPSNIAIAFFRIFQESLTNVARHANAKNVTAQLQALNGQLVLQIKDDGKGFEPANVGHKKTLGLLGMKERTQIIGGNYSVQSSPGNGATVTVTAPFDIS